MTRHTDFFAVAALAAICLGTTALAATSIYSTDLDDLAAGPLAGHPGSPDQDWWYRVMAGLATAEVHPTHGHPSQCLELFAPASNGDGSQTYGIRELDDVPLWRVPQLTLRFDAYLTTSDQTTSNQYLAQVSLLDLTEALGLVTSVAFVAGEHGIPRDVSGLDVVVLGYVEGISNLPLPLTVGQDLSWDAWHTVELVLSPATGFYVSLTVDGATQDLSQHMTPRFPVQGQWQPAEFIDTIECDVVSFEWGDPVQQTDDRVRLDNLAIEADFLEAPDFAAIADVGNDQGRQVRLTWLRSRYDSVEGPTILAYDVYRRQDAGRLEGWDYVMTVPAAGDDVYQCIAPTLCDSTEAGICWSAFLLRAMTSDPLAYYQSAPDSGYSVDNLAPVAPDSFVVNYGGDGVDLAWSRASAPDFRFYRIRRGTQARDMAVVHETVATSWHDPDGDWQHVYRLSVVDQAGNEGEVAAPTEVVGVGDAPMPVRLYPAAPNPFNPATVLAFDVPVDGMLVKLTLHDAAGRLVATLVEGPRPRGRHEATWRGEGPDGRRLPSGVYFGRLWTPEVVRVVKLTLVE